MVSISPMKLRVTIKKGLSGKTYSDTFHCFLYYFKNHDYFKSHLYERSAKFSRIFLLSELWGMELPATLSLNCLFQVTHPFSLNDDPSGMESWTHCCLGGRKSDSRGDDFLPEREQEKDFLGSAPDTK